MSELKHIEPLSPVEEAVVDRVGPLTACGPCFGDNDIACYSWCTGDACRHDGICCSGEIDN